MKIFISYHRGDTDKKNILIEMLNNNQFDYYVVPENADFDGMFHDHIAQIIIDEIEDCDVTICIVGNETYSRPHVDHEIKATLRGGCEGRKGLIAVMLDERQDNKNNINYNTFPNRIQDNLYEPFEYVVLKQWCSFKDEIVDAVELADEIREDCAINVINNRELMRLREGKYYD